MTRRKKIILGVVGLIVILPVGFYFYAETHDGEGRLQVIEEFLPIYEQNPEGTTLDNLSGWKKDIDHRTPWWFSGSRKKELKTRIDKLILVVAEEKVDQVEKNMKKTIDSADKNGYSVDPKFYRAWLDGLRNLRQEVLDTDLGSDNAKGLALRDKIENLMTFIDQRAGRQ